MNTSKPLPELLRPTTFDSLVGQEKLFAPTAPFRRLIESDSFHALLFWGPPGTGKTSTAQIVSLLTKRPFQSSSAVLIGVKELRALIENSISDIAEGKPAHLLFIDEIHRFSKSQQDVLLPALESGQIKFIGATTENPSFEVNNAILSRALVLKFEKISQAALEKLLDQSLAQLKSTRSIPEINLEVRKAIAQAAGGDARRALNLLNAVLASTPDKAEIQMEDLADLRESMQLYYDKKSEGHYDTISAFIKSLRASHPDAALHYLAKMIAGGEDPVFIARRMMIFASEDVGNASPLGLILATSCLQAVHAVGMPEGRIILAQCATYLASAPKSNRSYEGIEAALADVEKLPNLEVPLHLRNAVTGLMKEFGYGKGYAYAHHKKEEAKNSTYLPNQLAGKKYYIPKDTGSEKQILENLSKSRPTAD